ncbi:MAG: YceI family protein [Bryobacteraceae bacterium]
MSWTRSCLGAGVLMAAIALAQPPAPVVYEIRPSPQARFSLEVFKTGVMNGKKHVFLFGDYHGRLHFDRTSPANSGMELTLEAASAVCQDTWVSPKDLKKVQKQAFEMMDVTQHPQLSFSSQRIVPLGGNRFQVEGLLNIRGIAKPVTVTVTLAEQGDDTLVFSGGAEVRMQDYGLKPPSAALGMVGTKNGMNVAFVLQAKRVGP